VTDGLQRPDPNRDGAEPRNRDGIDARDRVADMYERYAPHVSAYALRRASGTDAADVVAETFLVAWRRHDVVPGEPDTLPWLYGVARRVLPNQRRTHRRRGRLKERLATQFVEHDVEQAPLEDVEEFQRVARAMGSLSDDDAELLRLTAWEALTPTESACVMDIEPGTARQRLRRARQRLRRQLAEQPDGEDHGGEQSHDGDALAQGDEVESHGRGSFRRGCAAMTSSRLVVMQKFSIST